MTAHPILPTGINSWEIAGDEYNGGGVNDPPIDPTWFTTLETFPLLLLPDDLIDVFEKECPDYVVPCVANTVTLPPEVREISIGRWAA